LQQNPQLPQTPMGAWADSQYQAAQAQLRADTANKYADILQQLGYVDPNGNFIQGSVESNANLQAADLNRQMSLADEQVTQQHQNLGTLFSGLRGTDQARAEYPMTQGLNQLMTQTPLTLQQLYEQAAGLVNQYNLSTNTNIADAASRYAAGLQASGGGGGGTGGGGSTGGGGGGGGTTGGGGSTPGPTGGAPIVGVGVTPGGAPTGPGIQNVGGAGINRQPAPAIGHYDPMRSIWVPGPAPTIAPKSLINPPASQLVTPVAPGRVQIVNGVPVVR